jgi:tetratricopeptide (TPR) repeat protein
MTEPIRSDASPADGDLLDRVRDARVEELLLIGLDRYFSGQYELAINVWTRVLFLDHGHARARAYIERARGAVAERQREGEELVHTGAAAFLRGEADAARQLLSSAVERGARTDEALALLDRLDRLEAAAVEARHGDQPPGRAKDRRPGADDPRVGRSRMTWIASGVACGIVTGALGFAFLWTRGAEWLPLVPPALPVTTVITAAEPLPVPASSEIWIARARALHAKGRLRDALWVLDAIRPDDPAYRQAEDLRAAIQRQLLAASRASDGPLLSPPAAAAGAPVQRR